MTTFLLGTIMYNADPSPGEKKPTPKVLQTQLAEIFQVLSFAEVCIRQLPYTRSAAL